MKRLVIVLAACVVGVAGGMGGARALSAGGAGAGEARAAEPVLHFERTVIDLGPVSDEQVIRQPFRFTYTGARMGKLKISHCHFCPQPEPDRDRYAPGQQGIVVIELPTMGKYGDVQTTVEVGVEGEPDSTVVLQLKAVVRPRIRVLPEFMNIKELVRAKGDEAVVTVVARDKGFALKGVRSESDWMEARLGEVWEKEDLGETCWAHPIHVRLKPGMPLGAFEGKIRAETTDSARPVIGYTIEAQVVGDLVARPDPMTVGWLAPGARYAGSFVLSSRSGRPLWYGSVRLAGEPAAGMGPMAFDVAPGEELGTLRVTVLGTAPLRVAPRVEGSAVVTVEDAEGAVVDEVRVPVRMGVRGGRRVR